MNQLEADAAKKLLQRIIDTEPHKNLSEQVSSYRNFLDAVQIRIAIESPAPPNPWTGLATGVAPVQQELALPAPPVETYQDEANEVARLEGVLSNNTMRGAGNAYILDKDYSFKDSKRLANLHPEKFQVFYDSPLGRKLRPFDNPNPKVKIVPVVIRLRSMFEVTPEASVP